MPAYVMDAMYGVLAWNRLASYFIDDLSQVPHCDRNVIRWVFTAREASLGWTNLTRLPCAHAGQLAVFGEGLAGASTP